MSCSSCTGGAVAVQTQSVEPSTETQTTTAGTANRMSIVEMSALGIAALSLGYAIHHLVMKKG
jgi:hypothetical protein